MKDIKNITLLVVIISTMVGSYFFLNKKNPARQHVESIDTIIIGTNAEYPPFSSIKNGEIAGLDIDIAEQVCARLNKKYVLQDKPFDALVPELQLGTVHMVAAGMTPTKQRERQVFFTTPYFKGDSLLIISPKLAPISNVEELTDKTVVVNEGFTADRYISSLTGPKVQRFPAVSEGFLALKSGRVDAFISAESSVQEYFKRYSKDDFNIVKIEGQSEEYSLAVSKKYPVLFADINKVIGDMLEDGTIAQLLKKWNIS